MAVTITRDMINSRSSSDGGTTPSGLFIRDVKEFIPMLTRKDTPLVKLIGTSSSENILKYEHGNGDQVPRVVRVTVALTAIETSATFNFPAYLQQYDIIKMPNGERVQVTQANPANPVTITRGYGGTTAEAVPVGVDLLVIAPAVPEGVDSPKSPTVQGELDWDTFQILEYTWEMTHRGRVTPSYEMKGDRFKHELKMKMDEAALDLESIAIHGIRYLPANITDATMTRGLVAATTTNVVDLAGAPLTLTAFLDGQQAVFDDVGPEQMGHDIIMAPFPKRVVNQWFNRTRRSSTTDAKMNVTWDSVDTDFGTYRFVVHHNHPKNRISIINTKDVTRKPYEGGNWTSGMFSTNGWYDRGFLRGDFGFVWPAARRRSAVVNFSISNASYPDLDKVYSSAA